MRIVLLYPPPWKIPAPGEEPDCSGEGPPLQVNFCCPFDGDTLHIPCGLLSLAAQARHAGHEVTVLNLYTFSWRDVCRIIELSPAELYGLSCFTANRRGVLATARLIRGFHPRAHITIGGPHASALPREMLKHCAAADTVVTGEGEATFNDLIARLEAGQPVQGIAGTAWREAEEITVAASRPLIADLDALVSPFLYYDDYIAITSRGCDHACTFCAAPFLWKGKTRFHSAGRVLDLLQQMVAERGHRAIAFKDDTFTADRGRVLAICREIEKRGMNFIWSCDTRADALDEGLLAAMRRAGCQRLSLGVESAAPEILRSLNKRISPADVRAATALAKKCGFEVRYYLIAGSREETAGTLAQTLQFIRETRPAQYIFNPFTILPGTKEYMFAERSGRVHAEQFFSEQFIECTPVPAGADTELQEMIYSLHLHPGVQCAGDYSAAERRAILERFPRLHAAHLDLGAALYREGDFIGAEELVKKALAMGYPLPGLCYNYLACIASAQGSLKSAMEYLIRAREQGFHQVVETNLQSMQQWLKAGGLGSGQALELVADHSFEITSRRQQPITPAPITLHDPRLPEDAAPLVLVPVDSVLRLQQGGDLC
jgi:radical SAM superfamily enzyme YgiQ (UPF0313 family)